jgi:D-glycero-D-manno-heptose 1,7-bisphosphate phosphatase
MQRAVFLDRDGTIIEDVDYLTRVEELRLLPGAAEALRMLKGAGFLLVVVTNQSAIARGALSEQQLGAIHAELNRRLEAEEAGIDAFYHCPHLPEGTVACYARICECRKPEPGLLEQAARDWGIALDRSYMVGDSQRDVEAGRRAGCATVSIGSLADSAADAAAEDLRQAASLILRHDWAARRRDGC